MSPLLVGAHYPARQGRLWPDADNNPVDIGCVFFWYRDVFFAVSGWPKSPFWYRDLFFGIEILHSVVRHQGPFLSEINLRIDIM